MECQFCKTEFNTIKALNLHLKTAKYCLALRGETNNNFECKKCGKLFSTNNRLNYHIKTCNEKSLQQKYEELQLENIMLKNKIKEYESKIKEYEREKVNDIKIRKKFSKNLVKLITTEINKKFLINGMTDISNILFNITKNVILKYDDTTVVYENEDDILYRYNSRFFIKKFLSVNRDIICSRIQKIRERLNDVDKNFLILLYSLTDKLSQHKFLSEQEQIVFDKIHDDYFKNISNIKILS